MRAETLIGKRVPKIDAKAKVMGRALYAADLKMPGMLYGKIVRCLEYAHARVTKLDLTDALKVPGVIKILGPGDVTSKRYNANVLDLMVSKEQKEILGDIEDQRIFTDYVKHQGDAICGIIAKSEEIAEMAEKKIVVAYEPLPVYLTAEASKKEDAVQFTEEKKGNLAFKLPQEMFPDNTYGWGDVALAMASADHIVEDTFYLPKVKQCQMEPNAYVALYDVDDRLKCWTSTQMPKCVHSKLSKLFELPMTRVKVTQTVIGGGFGARLGFVGEPETCAMALAVPGHPVRVEYSREEDWLASESRHPGKFKMKMGFKKDGTPLGVDGHFTSDKGGYYTHGSGVSFTTGAWLFGIYKWGTGAYKGDTYFTNQAPCGAYRGYGNPQTNFAMEQLIDRACDHLGIDPLEWRLKWHKDVGDDGWILGIKYLSCGLTECLTRGAESIGWKEKRKRYANQSGVKRRGIGVATMTHTSGAMPMLLEHTVVTVKINEDVTAEVMLACSDLGTGAHTALRQIAAETLGFELDDVHINSGDSDNAGFDIGAHASRTIFVGGGAVIKACEDAKSQMLRRAEKILDCPAEELKLVNKRIFYKKNPEKSVALSEITQSGVYNFTNPETGERNGIPGQIQGYASFFPSHNAPPFAACFAEVEVDMETGEVRVLKAINAHDIGKAIHPPSVEGQLEGGLQQGLGMILTEEMRYDENGLCLNNNFTDYKMFGPSDMPKCETILVEAPDPEGPFGAKSCGEAGLVAPVGAVANAIFHAIGIQMTECPITPERVLAAIKAKGISV